MTMLKKLIILVIKLQSMVAYLHSTFSPPRINPKPSVCTFFYFFNYHFLCLHTTATPSLNAEY